MPDAPTVLARLQEALPGEAIEAVPSVDQPSLVVPSAAIADVCRVLREHPELRFQVLAELTAADYWPNEPRFEVVYHFVCVGAAAVGFGPEAGRLRVKVRVPGSNPTLPTITPIYPNANWYEREVWDLFGVRFEGHPDLRRILMPDDWEGHPARKDYPVQVDVAVRSGLPLQVTEEEFLRNLQRQREKAFERP